MVKSKKMMTWRKIVLIRLKVDRHLASSSMGVCFWIRAWI